MAYLTTRDLGVQTPRLAVVGCGNSTRGDDGVGPAIIGRLRRAALPAFVQLHDAGTDGMAVLYAARGATSLVVIAARAAPHAPGAIYDVPGEVLEVPPPHSHTLHDFRWDHALYAAHRIFGEHFPAHVRVILVEAQNLTLGCGLTPAVDAAATFVCGMIRDMVATHWQAQA